MKLVQLLLNENIFRSPEFQKEVDKIKKQGGTFLGSGDYGAAFDVNGKVVKVTSDEVELEHAQTIEGVKTENFVFIFNVHVIEHDLGLITMEKLLPYKKDIPSKFIRDTKAEAATLGIDSTELDFVGDNVMQDASGNLKMIDV